MHSLDDVVSLDFASATPRAWPFAKPGLELRRQVAVPRRLPVGEEILGPRHDSAVQPSQMVRLILTAPLSCSLPQEQVPFLARSLVDAEMNRLSSSQRGAEPC